jgi:protein O-GlcNAc transferase
MPRSPRPGSPSHPAAPTLALARRRSEQRPHDPKVWKDLGHQQLHSDPEQALSSFEHALQLLPNEPQALELVAKAAQKLGQADRALALVLKALGINPDFAAGHHRLATLYFEKGQFAKALSHIDQALALAPHDCHMLSRKGLILNRLERHGEAIVVFDKLIEREPGDYSHWNNAANLYTAIGQLTTAAR